MRAEGVIIKIFPSRDADLVLRVILEGVGKMALFARSARTSQKRFGSKFDIFDRGTFEYSESRGSLLRIDSFTPSAAFRSFRTDLDKMVIGSVICDCLDALTREGADQTNQALLPLCVTTLTAVDEATSTKEALRGLYLSITALLDFAGFLDQSLIGTPSAQSLLKLLEHVELCSEKELATKSSLVTVLESLRVKPGVRTKPEVVVGE